MTEILDASVVIRTIGRPELIRQCLDSLAACDPRADEILVVDQSKGDETRGVIEEFGSVGARRIPSSSDRRGRSLAANDGFKAASHGFVFFTDDDCTVQRDWIGRGVAHMVRRPGVCVTGRILAHGDRYLVPVHRDDRRPVDYTGRPLTAALYACNFACKRETAIALGGFDEGLESMEDWDFGYRWVKGGKSLEYAPDLVVWHHDWRTASEMEQVWRDYARGVARFYLKLLRARDMNALLFLGRDVRNAVRQLTRIGKPSYPRRYDSQVFLIALVRELMRTLLPARR